MNKYHLLASVSTATLAMAGAANAADLPLKAKAAPFSYAPSWEGLYVGLNAGVASHKSVTKDLNNWADEGYVPSNTLKATGATFGGQIGYNWQEDGFVYGVEADINWVDASATDNISMCNGCTGGPGNVGTGGGAAIIKSEMNWIATFRGRAGITLGSAAPTFVYATGGLALAGINNRWGAGYNAGGAAARVSDSHFVSDDVKLGWVAGVGFEHKLRNMPNWSFKGEALWAQFENTDVTNPGPSAFNGVTQTFHTEFQNEVLLGRVGLNYKIQ